MIWSHLIGQKLLKKQMEYLLFSNQVPHAQLFSGLLGYGALPLAIEFSLGLLGCERNEEEHESLSKLCQNPDLHFVVPVVKKVGEKTAFSDDYSKEWLSFLDENPYGNYSAWFESISVGNKQGIIGIDDVKRAHKKMFLKSYAGQRKACIIWGADKMNSQAANAFLKLLEEPPKGTFFILVVEDTEMVLPTIFSRCQHIPLLPIDDESLKDSIHDKKFDHKEIISRADGDYNRMINLLKEDNNTKYEKLTQENIKEHIIHRHENLLLDSISIPKSEIISGDLSLTIDKNDTLNRSIFLKEHRHGKCVLQTPLLMEILALAAIVVSGKLKKNEMVMFAAITNFKTTKHYEANTALSGHVKQINAKNNFLKYKGTLTQNNSEIATGEMTAIFTTNTHTTTPEPNPSNQSTFKEWNKKWLKK